MFPLEIDALILSNTEKFLNQASEYSYTLVQRRINGGNLKQDELSKLKDLYNYSVEVNNTLAQISLEINGGTLNWKELATDGSSIFAKEVSNDSIDSFASIESNFEEYDGLIYDGAYSEHITSKDKTQLLLFAGKLETVITVADKITVE